MAIMEIRWDKKALEELKAAVLYCKKEYGEETMVYIQLLWDCRQSPEQLPQLLK